MAHAETETAGASAPPAEGTQLAQADPMPTAGEQTGQDVQDEESTLGAVIVTARRRDERLQDVPIAVSAITGAQADLIGVDSTDLLTVVTPSLDFGQQPFAAIPFLRGVGSSSGGAGFESPIAIYVDDVYYASPNAKLFTLDNIESVQVLKGPQGTLFGRNATGGVIQVKTKQPEFKPSGKVTAGYANYDTISGSFYATGGLSDNIAANIAVSGSDQGEGYGESVLTGVETQKSKDWNIRAQMLINLSEKTSVKLAADYSDSESDMGANLGVLPGSVGIGGTTFSGEYNTATDGNDLVEIQQAGLSMHVNHEMSFADLVSVSAYRNTEMNTLLDQDASPITFFTLDLDSPTKTFSQEFRLVSNTDGPLEWVTGVYYLNAISKYDPATLTGIIFDPASIGDESAVYQFEDKQTLNSYSGFAEGTYRFLPDTSLTLGIRYTLDEYEFESIEQTIRSSVVPEFDVPGGEFTLEDDFDKFTYRAILDHKFTDDIMGYASYSRGFKSGGYNVAEPGTADTQAAVRPEVLDAYEIGLKTSLMENRLTFNIAGYYYDYKDLAVSITRQGSLFVINAAAAEIKGVDADFVFSPMDGLRIAGGIGYIDSEYSEFPNGPTYTPNPNPPFGFIVGSADLSGNETQRSPELTLSVAPSYTFRAGNGAVTLAASYYHNSGYYSDPENRLEQPSYELVNASLGYQFDNGLGIRLWGKNLTDDRYFTFLQGDFFKDPAAYAPPRTYGITLSKEF